ncbi:spore germination protein [Paenibacillus sp. J2TS4]|uniref:spore germination protein n=1 Tax=Paenibacillus sp. J2TS4 TaxID=2807194 RepID=UPI001AFED5AB|nr:spore germination protein [Paenibacillus sp. J2TS4]GIP33225.1 spore germination protein [Paenibacillus sp. J2TS4]
MNFYRYFRKKLLGKSHTEKEWQHTGWLPHHWNEDTIHALFGSSADITVEIYQFGIDQQIKTILFYCEGMADIKQVNEFVLPQLNSMLYKSEQIDDYFLSNPLLQLNVIQNGQDLLHHLYDGNLVIVFEKEQKLFSADVSNIPHRTPEESNTEVSIKGPRDGFTEQLSDNIALIRKRLKTPSLHHEQFRVGRRSQTKVSLLYLYDVARPEVIAEVRHRINKLDLDGLLSNEQLEEALSDYSHSLFPLFDYIGRPDYASASLLRGRFVILIDGSPMAIIAPTNLTSLLKSPEDIHLPFYYVALERFFRLIGITVSILAPGLWVALTAYDIDQMPFQLLATVSSSRIGIPLSSPMEAFLMLGLFEIFREAGVRLPKAVGETVTVVGGLIVGDAAIRAGITSPTMLFVAAITAVATFTLVNQSLSGTVSVIRFFVLICSSFLGMYGFCLALITLVTYLSRLESFGLPYLSPLSPLSPRDLLAGLLIKPRDNVKKRPSMLHTLDSTRKKGDSS